MFFNPVKVLKIIQKIVTETNMYINEICKQKSILGLMKYYYLVYLFII